MNILIKFKRVISLLVIFLLTLECSNSRKESTDLGETNSVPLQPLSRADSLRYQRETREKFNDSVSIELLKKYPTALNVDTVDYSTYTILFQDLLEKSSNIVFVKEATIVDMEKQGGNLIITIHSLFPQIIARYQINSPLAEQLVSKLKMNDGFVDCCYVSRIKGFIPIHTDLVSSIEKFPKTPEDPEYNFITEEDVRDYVHIEFAGTSPLYFVKGELIDFYILN